MSPYLMITSIVYLKRLSLNKRLLWGKLTQSVLSGVTPVL